MASRAQVKQQQYNEWKNKLKTVEPELDLLSEATIDRIHSRKNPFPNMTKAWWMKKKTSTDVKALLIYLDPDLIPILTSSMLTQILRLKAPLTDPMKDYPGVYIGGFMMGKRELNVGEMVRLGNILVHPKRTKAILKFWGQWGRKTTLRSSKALGEAWRKMFVEMGVWRDLTEVEVSDDEEEFEDEFDDESDESDEDDEDDEEEEEVIGEGLAIPEGFNRGEYIKSPPYSPLYVGYGVSPKARLKAHACSISSQESY
jgi:hypothetical protein